MNTRVNESPLSRDTIILLATYNGEQYLEEQLMSILNQTYQNFMCYIHDDHSKDKTVEIIEYYCQKYPNKFTQWSYESAHGAVGNFMSMIQHATQKCCENYILFCDQDDIWLPDKVENEVNHLKKLEGRYKDTPLLVYCDQKLVDSKLNIYADSSMKYMNYTRDHEKFQKLVFENCAAGCVIAINRKLLMMAANFQSEDSIVMHDWWLMLIASVYGKIDYIDKPLMLYRQHNNNTLGAERKTLNIKLKKYMSNLHKSFNMKYKHIKKCEKQVIELEKLSKVYGSINTVNECSSICQKGKMARIYNFCKKGYISIKDCFTLLFL